MRGKSTSKKPEKTDLQIPEAKVDQPIEEKPQPDQTAADMKPDNVESELKLDNVETEMTPVEEVPKETTAELSKTNANENVEVKPEEIDVEIKPEEKECEIFAEPSKQSVAEDVFVKEIKKESQSSPILPNDFNASKYATPKSLTLTETTLKEDSEIKIAPKLTQLETDFEWKFDEDSKSESRIQSSASGRGDSSLISVRMKTMEELISSITVTAREFLGPVKNRRTVRSVVKEAKLRYDV